MKTYTFISKNRNLRIMLSPSIPAEPLLGRAMAPGEFAKFQDSILKVSNEEFAQKIMKHPGFNQDFILADGGVEKNPFPKSPEPEHDLIQIENGRIGKNLNPRPKFNLTPEIKSYLEEIADKMAREKFDALIKNASELFKAVKAEKEVIADLASSIVGEKADVVTENTADAIEVNPTVTATEDPLVDNKKKKAGRPKKVVNKLA